MSNKVSSVNSSNLLDNKLSVILEKLNEDLKDSGVVEKELLLAKFNETINKFYKTLNSPLLSAKEFRQGTFPNFKEINGLFQEVEQDLKILYKEINSLERFIVTNYNTLNTEASALRSRLRRVSSDLGDYRLQASDNLGGATYFSDSFQNTDKIDYQDKLYNEAKASIDIQSGAMILPINTGRTKNYSISEISIGSGSNGQIGNNQEINALLRGELKSISDSNPDTWFEYERVTSNSSTIPLILEAKMTLDKDSIVNNIAISTTSFATKSYPRITKLEVSVDGKLFTNIIDQIPTSTFFEDTTDKVVLLDPSSGKFSGVTKIKIPPAKIRYINIVFQQDDAYIIKTPSGLKYRKAIGIRGIDFIGEVYQSKGEIVSINYASPDEIKKVSLVANKLVTPGLTDIKHYISIDDGQNWNEIQSIEKISRDVKEILTFNLEDVDGSIATESPAVSIRHKALLERTPNGFSTRGGVEKTRESKSDFLNIAAGTQTITLTERPISSSVVVKNVSFGSVGGSDYHLVNTSDIVTRDNFTYVYLPDPPFYKNSIAENQELIKINNELWGRVADLSTASSSDKVYEFDYLNNIIKFGDDVTGKSPDSDIFIGLKKEQVGFTSDSPRKIISAFTPDGVKETTKLYRLDAETTKANVVLAKGSSILRTGIKDITSISVVSDPSMSLMNEKTFINGASELLISGDYSIDYSTGIIYVKTLSSETADTIININYYPRVEISDLAYLPDSIQIPESSYISTGAKETIALSGTNVIRLGNKFIEPRSLRFLSLSGNFKTEVPFKGDGTEFDIGLSPAELNGYYSIDYKNGVIYTYNNITGTFILEYNITKYFMEYSIAVEVPRDDYSIDEENNTITFTNKYVIKNFSDSLSKNFIRTLFKVDYDFITELEQNPRELEPYFTPLLKDYALVVLTKGQI